MEQPERNDKLREPLDDEERELMDPETWDWDSAESLPPAPASYTITDSSLPASPPRSGRLIRRSARRNEARQSQWLLHGAEGTHSKPTNQTAIPGYSRLVAGTSADVDSTAPSSIACGDGA
jgi:hypothetical protein